MNEEAAKMLIHIIAVNLDATTKLRNRVNALEKALSRLEPALYDLYQTNLQDENRDSSALLSQEELAALAAEFRQK